MTTIELHALALALVAALVALAGWAGHLATRRVNRLVEQARRFDQPGGER